MPDNTHDPNELEWLANLNNVPQVALDESSNIDLTPDRNDTLSIAESVTTPPVGTTTIVMGKDKFAAFMSVLQFLKNSCQDLYIKNGKITQLNSKRSMFFEIDLTSIFGDSSIAINNILGKFDMLNIFKKQGVDVYLDIYPTGSTFRDSQSKINFKRPVENFLEPTHCTEQEIQDKLSIDPNRRIFSYVWQKIILDRIISAAKSLGAATMNIGFFGDNLKFTLGSLDNKSSTQMDIMTLEDELDDTTITGVDAPFPSMCFINFIQGGLVEINSQMYYRNAPTCPSVVLKLYAPMPIAGTDLIIPVTVSASAKFSSQGADGEGNII